MSAIAAGFEVKGWCPGALRPMESGDGLIVRVRPFCGSLSVAEMHGIADAAARFGNGYIDLTRRANLQIRGVTETTLGPLQETLGGLGMLDDRPEAEAVRNILVSPLAGLDPAEALDMRDIARDLARRLATEPDAWLLPAKFAFVLDGGGQLSLAGERADLRLLVMKDREQVRIAVGMDHGGATEWFGAVQPGDIIETVFAAIRAILAVSPGTGLSRQQGLARKAAAQVRASLPAQLQPLPGSAGRTALAIQALGVLRMPGRGAVAALGVPFGCLKAAQLTSLANAIPQQGGQGVRLSPWRAFYIPLPNEAASDRLMAKAGDLGFLTDAGDPLMRIQACPGSPACRAAHAKTRTDAREVASWIADAGFSGTAHLSGCAKGCARSAPADLMLVGMPGGYRMMRNARAQDEGGAFVNSANLRTSLETEVACNG